MSTFDDERQYRQFPLRLDKNLDEAFYKIFPDYGSRSIFLREVIREVIRQTKANSDVDIPSAVSKAMQSTALKLRLKGSE